VSAEVVPGEGTYVISERGITAFDDERVAVVAPLLNGTRDFRTVVADASGRCSPADVALAIGRLNAADLLAPAEQPPSAGRAPAADAYWELAGVPGPTPRTTVEVRAVGAGDALPALRACTAAGLDAALAGTGRADLTLVICDDYLDPRLREVDARQRAAGRPWLLAKPHGTTPWVGPVFRPEGACWQCLAHRMAGHRGAAVHLSRVLGRTVPHPRAETSASLGLGRQLAVAECEKWLAGYRYAGQDGVLTFDTLSLTGRLHRLTARPQCPGCGDPGLVARRVRRPLVLRSRPKAEVTGSGHRAVPAQ
jgi:ribosomal protein S12 methylthiotransferase accessory factor